MNSKVCFGKWESSCLLITMMGTKAVVNIPKSNVEVAGSAGWILPIYTGFIVLVVFMFISKLYKPFGGKDLIEISELAGGKLLRVIMGLVVVAFFMFIISADLRIFSEEMKTMAYEESPISFIMLLFVIGIIISVYLGIEAIVRFQAILVPISIIAFTIFIIGLNPYYELINIFPILGTGPKNLFINGAMKVSEYSELLMLFLLVPFISRYDDFKKVGRLTIIISSLVMSSLTAAFIAIIGYPHALTSFLSAYELGRLIDYGRYLERAESLLIITWSTMALMYLCGGFFFIVYTYSITFNLKYYRPLIIPFAIVIFSLALLPESLLKTVDIIILYFRNYSWVVTFLFTTIILLVGRARIKDTKPEAG